MADANLKAHPPVTERFVTIQQSRRDSRSKKPYWLRPEPPLFPWMKLAERWIEQADFRAG
ncbi:hypothetical protein QZM22_13365 [Burkholderia oklahomensis]|uniref:hypothetical protein n=1 Tax=Burkholderia oklahomensis TaxID=342113 RepID=UPI00264E94F9|nr:hypothetical protein [Burkholderia oklahomensis]MDN7673481.1 hypothetical protein [Burkholderia oklahomensis]